MAVKERVVKITVKGQVKGAGELKRVSKQLGSINREAKKTSNSISFLRNSFAGFVAALGVRQLTRAADEFQLLQDRIRVFTGSAEETKKVYADLIRAARLTKTSVAALGMTFNRVALATQELGLSSNSLLAVTVGLQQSFRLAGATIAEARAATIQLSQGLSSGELRGQELRSVMEQNAVFAGMLSEELKIGRGQLIKWAEQGKITSEVVLRTLVKNFKLLSKNAAGLGQTFEQSAIIALDLFKVKIDELNKVIGASSKFAYSVELLINNFDKVTTSLIVLGGVLVGYGLAKGFTAIAASMATYTASVIAAKVATIAFYGAFTLGAFFIIDNMDIISRKMAIWMQKLVVMFDESTLKFKQWILDISKVIGLSDKLGTQTNLARRIKKEERALSTQRLVLDKLTESYATWRKEQEKIKKTGADKYLERLFKSLKRDVDSLSESAKKTPLQKLNAEFSKGGDLEAYGSALSKIKLGELNNKFKQGKIDVYQYYKELIKLPDALNKIEQAQLGVTKGLTDYIESTGNLASNIAATISNVFKNLENVLVDFVRKGELEFEKLVNAILDDLARLTIRMAITQPLAAGLLGAAGTPGAGERPLYSANGNAFNNGRVTPFARGGVVDRPTFFKMANGAGVMGEEGPEAVIPLKRGKDGKLGVSGGGGGVVVNVNNFADAKVETTTKSGPNGEQILEVVIRDKVKELFGSGSMDKTLNESYGLQRRGR